MYRKIAKTNQDITPWDETTDMDGVSVSDFDKASGSPKKGDVIANCQENPHDRWLIEEEWFKDNYEYVEETSFVTETYIVNPVPSLRALGVMVEAMERHTDQNSREGLEECVILLQSLLQLKQLDLARCHD